MAYTTKTKVTNQPVDEYLSTVSEKRRNEAHRLIELMERASGESAKMWGPSMIGFGSYHYVTKSRCEADWFKIGFSPRQAKLSLYVSCDLDEFESDLARLGKYTRGKGCIYVNKLEDIDLGVLEEISSTAYANTHDMDMTQTSV